MSEQR